MLITRWLKSLTGSRTSAPRTRPGKFWVEVLEDRTALAAFATGAAVGEPPLVRVFDADTRAEVTSFRAYDPAFTGGVNVAMGDVTGDGTADIITATATGADHVKVFDGVTFREVRSFLAFGGFGGGVNVASGDVNGDGRFDMVVSVAGNGAPHVKAFSGADGSELASFLAYDAAFAGGVRVAVGDVDGDGKADIVTGSGPGAIAHLKVFDGATGAATLSVLAFPVFQGGLNVAAGDIDGDGKADLVVGAAGASGGHVKAFDGESGAEEASFFAFDAGFTGGVQVGVGPDTNGDGNGEITVGAIGTQHVKTFDAQDQQELSSTLEPGGGGGLPTSPANSAPVLAEVGAKSGAELGAIAFTLSAADPNGGTLTYSATGLPVGATFNGATGAFAWTPSTGQAGTYSVTFRVSDGQASDDEVVTITVAGTNLAPVLTSNGGGATASVSLDENATAVTTVAATDANPGSTLTYSIVSAGNNGAPDAARFTIDPSTGVLTFATAPDFEAPADEGLNNVYDVTVLVSDGTLTATQTIAVTVLNVNEAPVVAPTGEASVGENGTAVTTIAATDPESQTLTYTLGGADAARFSITSGGVLTFASAPDFESPLDDGADNMYNVTVTVSDGTNSAAQVLTVAVTNVNEAPTITSHGGLASVGLSADENGTSVTTITATDADAGTTLTYTISGGADAARFAIDPGTGVLTFLTAPDFEVPTDEGLNNVYDVVVTASDGTLTATQAVAVTVTDVSEVTNQPPVVTTSSGTTPYSDGAPPVIVDSAVTVTDADAGDTIVGATVAIGGFVSGDVLAFDSAAAAGFGISGSFNGSSGVLTLTGTATAADYQSVLQTVTFATTAGLSGNIPITFSVNDGDADGSGMRGVNVTV